MFKFPRLFKYQAIEDDPEEGEPTTSEMEQLQAEIIANEQHTIRGRVHKAKHKKYKLGDMHRGGQVVKTMPRGLRKLKEQAEND